MLGAEPGDPAAQRVLVFVEVSHARRRVVPGAQRGRNSHRHHVVHVVGEQVQPLVVRLSIEQVCLIDEELVGAQVALIAEGQCASDATVTRRVVAEYRLLGVRLAAPEAAKPGPSIMLRRSHTRARSVTGRLAVCTSGSIPSAHVPTATVAEASTGRSTWSAHNRSRAR